MNQVDFQPAANNEQTASQTNKQSLSSRYILQYFIMHFAFLSLFRNNFSFHFVVSVFGLTELQKFNCTLFCIICNNWAIYQLTVRSSFCPRTTTILFPLHRFGLHCCRFLSSNSVAEAAPEFTDFMQILNSNEKGFWFFIYYSCLFPFLWIDMLMVVNEIIL